MEILFRRLLGLYFVVLSFGYVPTTLAYLGVENAFGPRWVLLFIPLSQAAIFLVAGLILLRKHSAEAVPLGPGVVFPALDSLLQLAGVYFIVTGLGSVARPAVDMLFVTEAWVARLGSFMEAAVLLVGGYVLVKHPQAVVQALTDRQRPNRPYLDSSVE
jgi:hypothetical protein